MYRRIGNRLVVRSVYVSVLVIYVSVLEITANARTKIWIDNFSLWTDVIENYPNHYLAFCNRAPSLGKEGNVQLALNDCNNCIRLRPELPESYNNRAMVYSVTNKWEKALDDFQYCNRTRLKLQHSPCQSGFIIHENEEL